MKARARGDITATKDGQLLTFTDGEIITGDMAAYLLRTGASVTPEDGDAEAVLNDDSATGHARDEIGDAQADRSHRGPLGRPPYGTATAPEGSVPDPRRDVSTGGRPGTATPLPAGIVVNDDGTVSDTAQRTVPDTPSELASVDTSTRGDTTTGADFDGKIADILAWVGSDTARADTAHQHESAKEQPRTSLLAKLDDIRKA